MSLAFVRLVGTVAVGVVVVCSACSREIGRRFDMSAADSLTPGVSTLPDAIAVLGPPTAGFKSLRGTEVAQWTFLEDQSRGTESADLMVLFGADGRMIAITRREERKMDDADVPPES